MKKITKLIGVIALAVVCFCSSILFTGCSVGEKEQNVEKPQTVTTSEAPVELFIETAGNMLVNAIHKSIATKNITMKVTTDHYFDGLYDGKEEAEVYEKVVDNKATIYSIIKAYYPEEDTPIVEDEFWEVFIEDEYVGDRYCYLDETTKLFSTQGVGNKGCSARLLGLLDQLGNDSSGIYIGGSYYFNGVIQIEVGRPSWEMIITLDQAGRIEKIKEICIDGGYRFSEYTFSYNNVTFAKEVPTSLNGYTEENIR